MGLPPCNIMFFQQACLAAQRAMSIIDGSSGLAEPDLLFAFRLCGVCSAFPHHPFSETIYKYSATGNRIWGISCWRIGVIRRCRLIPRRLNGPIHQWLRIIRLIWTWPPIGRRDTVAPLLAPAEKVPAISYVVIHEPIKVHPAPFSDRVSGWPIGDTRHGFRRRRAGFPAWLCGLAAVCRVRFARQLKKIPDAVFCGEIAVPGRGCSAEVSHLSSTVIAASGG